MLRWLLIGLLALACGPAWGGDIAVSVKPGERGVFELEGKFLTGASSGTAWAVLTDYERLPAFVSSMRSSVVKQRRAGELLLEQESVGRVLFFSRTVRVALRVREEPPRRISFEDESKNSFDSYAGSWAIDGSRGGVQVTYRLKAKGGFATPGFMTRGVSRRMVRALLQEVRAEMERRAAAVSLLR